jgi:hypothetical protein
VSYGLPDEVLEERIRRTSQAPDRPGVPDCCKREGQLQVTTEDGERFTGLCLVCGRKHRRAFPDLSKILKVTKP